MTVQKKEEGTPLSRVVPATVPREAVIESLIRAVNDHSKPADTRISAMDTLRKFDSERVTDVFIALAKDGNPEIRTEAIALLSDRKGPQALDRLYERLKNDPDEKCRWHASLSLKDQAITTSKTDSARIVRELAHAAITDPAARNREFAVTFLNNIANDRDASMTTRQLIAGYLTSIAISGDLPSIRIEAIEGLGDIGRPSYPKRLSAAYAILVSTVVTPGLLAASLSRDKDVADAAKAAREHVLEWEKTMQLRKSSGKP